MDPDEAEQPHLDLYCLQIELFLFWDGWMTSDFTSFSTVFQSYHDDGLMLMKGCAVVLHLRLRRFRFQRGSNSVH